MDFGEKPVDLQNLPAHRGVSMRKAKRTARGSDGGALAVELIVSAAAAVICYRGAPRRSLGMCTHPWPNGSLAGVTAQLG